MSEHYYNTTRQTGETLARYEAAAMTQEEAVLDFFEKRPTKKFSAEDIGRRVLPKAPRTSWGRCLTNLMNRGLIEKLDEMVEGEWGREIHLWRLARPIQRQGSLL